MKVKFDIAIVQKLFECKQTFGMRKAVEFSPTSMTQSSFLRAAVSIRARLMCNLSSEKVRLLFECGFTSSAAFIHDCTVGLWMYSLYTVKNADASMLDWWMLLARQVYVPVDAALVIPGRVRVLVRDKPSTELMLRLVERSVPLYSHSIVGGGSEPATHWKPTVFPSVRVILVGRTEITGGPVERKKPQARTICQIALGWKCVCTLAITQQMNQNTSTFKTSWSAMARSLWLNSFKTPLLKKKHLQKPFQR